MDNKKIAEIFEEMGNILDIKGANFFRVNGYRKGALAILNLPQDLREMVEKEPKEIVKLDGIGKGLADKIIELVETGKCKEYAQMKKGFPAGLLEMLSLRGLGPKKVKLLYSKLNITTLKQLKKAAETGKIQELEGMGAKSETEILKSIEERAQFSTERHSIDEALQEAERVIEYMETVMGIKRIQYAGSLRRSQETIGDIDILVTVKKVEEIPKMMKHFVANKEVFKVIAEGDTKSAVVLQSGIQVDLRVVPDESFGAALHYFSGNKQHNILIRDMAKKKGLKVNEYGVFKGEKSIAGKEEKDLFNALGLPYIPPELRQGKDEVEYAKKHKTMPKLVELADIKADLHSHSKYSDGKATIEEMAKAFMARGYEYFAVTDHSSIVGVTGGMKTKDIKKQWKEIERLDKKLKIKILKGVEVDILKDGKLDFEDEVLKELDVVIISAHLHGRLEEAAQTKRLIAAIENPYAKILGHPTGRLVNKRPEMKFKMEKVIEACVINKVALEINSNPMRLDLVDKYVRMAKEMGAKFVINTDGHSTEHPEFMKFGVGVARRGWLTKKDVLNAGSFKEFDNYF